MSMIKYTNTERACLGEVYDGMDTMIEKIRITIAKKENIPKEVFFKRIEKIILHHWNKMTT